VLAVNCLFDFFVNIFVIRFSDFIACMFDFLGLIISGQRRSSRDIQGIIHMAKTFRRTAEAKGEIKDVYQRITDQIVADLENGVRTWLRPWNNDGAADVSGIRLPIRATGENYRGINVFLLWGAAAVAGYTNPMWMTFNKAKELGGNVRKGEKGTFICYASTFVDKKKDEAGNVSEKIVPFLKGYTVFNIEQIDSLPERYYAKPSDDKAAAPLAARLEAVDRFVAKTGADVREGGNRAFYSPAGDSIQMPPAHTFKTPEGFASTLLHETVHWSGHAKRMARTFGSRFGDEAYAVEELVAELGAAFLSADLGVAAEARPDHAAYVASWLKVLKNDKRAIFTAASAAQKASDFLHDLQGDAVEEREEELEAA
jgi:antirestriction protein ArdC